MTQKNIAIIPARSGSKRLPKKNIALFNGKSLPAHTIEQALASDIFDRIVVTSNEPAVIDIASNYNITLDQREDSLSTDKTPLTEVIKNIIGSYNLDKNSIITLLLVTCPLRTVEDIQRAYDLYVSSNQKRSLVSVTPMEYPVEMSWTLQDGYLISFMEGKQLKSTQKQNFEKRYKYNDAIIIDSVHNFLEPDRILFGKNPLPYIMPAERSIAIDYEFDLKLAHLIWNHGSEYGF